MAESSSQLRIWEGFLPVTPGSPPVRGARADGARPATPDLAECLAMRESLRNAPRSGESAEPFSLQWFLDVEVARYARQGHWLPHLLEFGRHSGETLLGLGYGLGTDWVQFARGGAAVIACSPAAEHLALVRRNFELRGLNGTFLHAGPANLPLETGSIDVACVNGLLHEVEQPGLCVEEIYRVLKPGGKVMLVVPARLDVEFWARRLSLGLARAGNCPAPAEEPGGPWPPPVPQQRLTARTLKQLFARFTESRVHKRHLRRADLPHLWRWFPLPLLERLMGRMLIFKAFKPLSAARVSNAAA